LLGRNAEKPNPSRVSDTIIQILGAGLAALAIIPYSKMFDGSLKAVR
jgi:hypothetical protein